MNKEPRGHECLRNLDDHESFANACLFIISSRIQNTPSRAKENLEKNITVSNTRDPVGGDLDRDVLYQEKTLKTVQKHLSRLHLPYFSGLTKYLLKPLLKLSGLPSPDSHILTTNLLVK